MGRILSSTTTPAGSGCVRSSLECIHRLTKLILKQRRGRAPAEHGLFQPDLQL